MGCQSVGGYQAETSYRLPDGSFATAWSYPPFGPFDPAKEAGCPDQPCKGDGGEQYVVNNGTVTITKTQDGGQRGVQTFNGVPWVLIAPGEPECSAGWMQFNAQNQGCHTTLTLPVLGSVDAYVAENSGGDHVERIILAKGYGRVVWQACAAKPIDPGRAPDFGWNACPVGTLSDERLSVNFIPLSTLPDQLWHP